MDYKKISVLIVTYKQADVIGRNIESILQQKEYGLHEIVISDDCSPDNNWEVIQSYVEKYPGIIRAYRNNPNLGIYGNSNKLITMAGDADLFCWVEGDDALCDGFFKKAQEAIVEQKINVNEHICIQADFKAITPQGKEFVFDNSYLARKECSSTGAKLRGWTTWRATLFSKPVLNDFKQVDISKGLALAESLFDNEWFFNIDKAFYIKCIGSIYYTDIGVSVDLKGDCDYQTKEMEEKWHYWMNNPRLTKEDQRFAKAEYTLAKLKRTHSFKDYLVYVFYYLMGNISYPFNWHLLYKHMKLCK